MLLRAVDGKIHLLHRLAACFSDGRRPERIEHTVFEMLSQRIYGLALGYEDLNDHEQLRKDVVFGLLSGKRAGSAAGRQEHAQPAGAVRAQ